MGKYNFTLHPLGWVFKSNDYFIIICNRPTPSSKQILLMYKKIYFLLFDIEINKISFFNDKLIFISDIMTTIYGGIRFHKFQISFIHDSKLF